MLLAIKYMAFVKVVARWCVLVSFFQAHYTFVEQSKKLKNMVNGGIKYEKKS